MTVQEQAEAIAALKDSVPEPIVYALVILLIFMLPVFAVAFFAREMTEPFSMKTSLRIGSSSLLLSFLVFQLSMATASAFLIPVHFGVFPVTFWPTFSAAIADFGRLEVKALSFQLIIVVAGVFELRRRLVAKCKEAA